MLLALARRVVSFSRGAGVALLLLPLLFTGRALLTGRVYAPVDLAYSTEPLASIARTAGIHHLGNTAVSDVYAQFIPWHAAVREAHSSIRRSRSARSAAAGNACRYAACQVRT